MAKITVDEVLRFAEDLKEKYDEGDLEAVKAISSKLKNDLAFAGPDITNKILESAKQSLKTNTPLSKIEGMNQIGYWLENPRSYYTTSPDEGFWPTLGKGVVGGALRPFAGPEGKKAYDRWRESRQRARPKTVMGGDALGNIAGYAGVERALKPIKGVGGVGRAIGAGALIGTADEEQNTLQTTIGAGAGAAAGRFLGNRVTPKGSIQPKDIQALNDKQRRKGYWASPGQQSGRSSAKQLDHALKKHTGTTDAVNSLLTKNRAKLTAEVAEAVGLQKNTRLDVDTLIGHNEVLNTKLDSFYSTVTPVYTRGDRLAPSRIRTMYRNSTGTPIPKEFEMFSKRYNELINASKGRGTGKGKQLRSLIRDISQRETAHFTRPDGNRALGQAYRTLKQNVENGIKRTVGGKRLDEWQEMRTQQALLLDLVEKDKGMLSTGEVTPSSLRNIIESGKSRNLDYITRRRDLWDSARFVDQQEAAVSALHNSLSISQRLGRYLMADATPAQVVSDITKEMPIVRAPMIHKYLHSRHYRLPRDEAIVEGAGVLGGGLGVSIPSVEDL
jgi:hypothetical protein